MENTDDGQADVTHFAEDAFRGAPWVHHHRLFRHGIT
jgi:hypothetical protein